MSNNANDQSQEFSQANTDSSVDITVSRYKSIRINNFYETWSIVNDILISLVFITGSVLFFFQDLMTVGTCFFLVGSFFMAARPAIRLVRRVHLQKTTGTSYRSTGYDYQSTGYDY